LNRHVQVPGHEVLYQAHSSAGMWRKLAAL
jgi:hypothetical protein